MLNRIPQSVWKDILPKVWAPQPEIPADEFFGTGIEVLDDTFVPFKGFKKDSYVEYEHGKPKIRIPTLIAQAHRDQLAALFIELTGVLSDEVDLFAESSDGVPPSGEIPMWRAPEMDLVVVQSALWGQEEMLAEDGMTEIAVCDFRRRMEVRLTEDKILYCYGRDKNIRRFIPVLERHGIPYDPEIVLVNTVRHDNYTTDHYQDQFRELLRDVSAELLDDDEADDED